MSERIVSIDNFIENVGKLEYAIKKYSGKSSEYVKLETLRFIRKESYDNYKWDITGGIPNSEIREMVLKDYSGFRTYFAPELKFKDHKGNVVDAIHFAATLNGYLMSYIHVPYSWCGWAGDLATLVAQVVEKVKGRHDSKEIYDFAVSLLNHNKPSFETNGRYINNMGIEDTLADIDASNIKAEYNCDTLKDSLLLYYNSNSAYGRRYSRFIYSLAENKDRDVFRKKVRGEMESCINFLGKTKNYGYPTNDQKHAVTGAFTDVIFRRANAE